MRNDTRCAYRPQRTPNKNGVAADASSPYDRLVEPTCWIVTPADPQSDVYVLPVENGKAVSGQRIADLVGGFPEVTSYDFDAHIFVNDAGRIDGLALNERATDYILVHSQAAAQHGMRGAHRTAYGLYGDAVITGLDAGDVPDRLVEHFELDRPGFDVEHGNGSLVRHDEPSHHVDYDHPEPDGPDFGR
jgi:hypothetical protein